MAHSGLFVDPVPGTPPVGTSMADGRLALGGIVGTTFRCLSGGAVTLSSSDMTVTIGQAVWAIPDLLGGTYVTPTDTTALAPAVGPSTGSRIDAIVVTQDDYGTGSTDSRANLSIITGTASTSPTAPTTPAGSQQVGTITVPTGATTASACTFAGVVGTASNGGQIIAFSPHTVTGRVSPIGSFAAVSAIFTYGSSSEVMAAWQEWLMGYISPAPAMQTRVVAAADLGPSQEMFVYLNVDGTVTINSKESIQMNQNTTWIAFSAVYPTQ